MFNNTGGTCGQPNPVTNLASHAASNLAQQELLGSISTTPDPWSQEAGALSSIAPQSFRMDNLVRELQEVQAVRTVPSVPANEINLDSWANEFCNQQRQNYSAPSSFQENVKSNWHDGSVPNFHVGQHQFLSSGLNIMQSRVLYPVYDIVEPNTKTLPNFCLEGEFQTAEETLKELEQNAYEANFSNNGENDINAVVVKAKAPEEEGNAWAEEFVVKSGQVEDPEPLNVVPEVVDDGINLAVLDNVTENSNIKKTDFDNFTSGLDFEQIMEDVFGDYQYVENNPMSEVVDPLKKGKELLSLGDIPGAVLCFEVAVKEDPSSVEAWRLLGTTWAENEQDPKAIYALKQGLNLDPNNMDILMALAVSYTNENYNYQACSTLLSWLQNHPEYKDVVPKNFVLKEKTLTLLLDDQLEAIQNMFIKVARRRPQDPDYEVQCALGVLFNLNYEYDKAADCFRSALQRRPDDSRMWNRLGATLANGNKPAEAIDAYHRALNIDPGFVRSRYNVGITCMNMKAYTQAAEHFLITLNQQARGQQNVISTSDTIWSTLRLCTSLMGRYDLRAALNDKDLTKLNKEFKIDLQ